MVRNDILLTECIIMLNLKITFYAPSSYKCAKFHNRLFLQFSQKEVKVFASRINIAIDTMIVIVNICSY